MRLKLIGIVGALLVLTACETAPMDASSNSGMGAARGGVGNGYGAGGPGGVGVGGAGGVGSGGAAGLSGSRNGAGGVIPGSQQDLANNVGDRVFFGYDQTDLSTEARTTLERQAAWLKQFGNVTVTVEGHSDERGTREYNLALGDRRANSVKNYLVTQGVAPNRIATLSYGKERPAIGASGDQAWAQNRRGVTVVN
ncbi:OmpA/MotB [Skermanella stibiiresistens SB22]|uniref:Peptidoglycan-associated lipoprotein n=1 Tax=Skermanella stibiiresistens SB22 TaxID=1385369 RepID=W9H737_9PROT|nr:peptidoglycan-associated lipoprotein Pal [Skermanella stibiiresistens]EWY39588.1 OmpA/MotB [Skermanella stibiiresistens SB22]